MPTEQMTAPSENEATVAPPNSTTAPPPEPALDLRAQDERGLLIASLAARGVSSYESDLGGGLLAVVIPLVTDDGLESLAVTAYPQDTLTRLHVSGFRHVMKDGESDYVDCDLPGDLVETLNDVADWMLGQFRAQNELIEKFRAGELDVDAEVVEKDGVKGSVVEDAVPPADAVDKKLPAPVFQQSDDDASKIPSQDGNAVTINSTQDE